MGGSTVLSGNNTINKLMDRVISKIVKLGYASCDNFRYNTPIRLLIVQYIVVSRQVLSHIDGSCFCIESCTTRILYNAAVCRLSCVDEEKQMFITWLLIGVF